MRKMVVLTGGPGGGKSTLQDELAQDPQMASCFVMLPETVQVALETGIVRHERFFQRVMTHLQIALEDGLDSALGSTDTRPLLLHRGALDPLAYWLARDWREEDFYSLVGISKESLYERYFCILHLVTAADGAPSSYRRWPDAHRQETLEESITLDIMLQRAWGDHPNYHRIDNIGRDWSQKSSDTRRILCDALGLDRTSDV